MIFDNNIIINNNLKAFKSLINKYDVNDLFDEQGYSLVYRVTEQGNFKMLSLLIDKDVDVNSIDKWGTSPISIACVLGFTKIVDFLIKNGADVNINSAVLDGTNSSPLEIAVTNAHYEIVKLLLKANAQSDDDTELIINAVVKKDIRIVKALIDYGISVKGKDSNNKTPLLYAFEADLFDIFKLLLENGASLYIEGIWADNIVVYSIRREKFKYTELIIDSKIDIEDFKSEVLQKLRNKIDQGKSPILCNRLINEIIGLKTRGR